MSQPEKTITIPGKLAFECDESERDRRFEVRMAAIKKATEEMNTVATQWNSDAITCTCEAAKCKSVIQQAESELEKVKRRLNKQISDVRDETDSYVEGRIRELNQEFLIARQRDMAGW